MSILQILQVFISDTLYYYLYCAEHAPIQKQGLSITYVDSFEITSSTNNVQLQYVAIECVQQVQVDKEKRIMIEDLKSIHEDASIEEVFCTELSSESMCYDFDHHILRANYTVIMHILLYLT